MRFKAVVTSLLALLCLAELIKYCTCIVVKPALALARPKREKSGGNSIANEEVSLPTFWLASLAGALSCSLTHTMLVPLDLIKTRMQTDNNFIGLSTRSAAKMIKASEGLQGLVQGVSAVATGYFLQGAAKFGIYDKLKRKIRLK